MNMNSQKIPYWKRQTICNKYICKMFVRLLKLAAEYSPRVHLCMGNINMTHHYAPDERWNDTGIVITVFDEDGWEYTVPKDVKFSYESTKQVTYHYSASLTRPPLLGHLYWAIFTGS